jgi:hypothetical protein
MDASQRAEFETALRERLDKWNHLSRLGAEVTGLPAEIPLMTPERRAVALALAFVMRRMNELDDPEAYIEVAAELRQRELPVLVHMPSDSAFEPGIDADAR